MSHDLIISTSGMFQVRRNKESSEHELFHVAQKSEGTKVCRLESKKGGRKTIPVPLKRKRYSLSCVTGTPKCGYNFTDFQKDFWEAIEMEVQP